MTTTEKPDHLGHRKRLRQRFVDSELLELLLFQAIPRQGTKPNHCFGQRRLHGMDCVFLTHRRFSTVAVVAALMLVGACSILPVSTVTPERVTKPTRVYDTIVVGDVTMIEDEVAFHWLPLFRNSLVRHLEKEPGFKTVLSPAPDQIPKSAILVTGRITEIDTGDAVVHFLGFGLGRATVRGTFEIHDASKRSLVKFQRFERYSGGKAGWDMTKMEELLEKLGEETAKSVIKWSQGKDLKPPSPE